MTIPRYSHATGYRAMMPGMVVIASVLSDRLVSIANGIFLFMQLSVLIIAAAVGVVWLVNKWKSRGG